MDRECQSFDWDGQSSVWDCWYLVWSAIIGLGIVKVLVWDYPSLVWDCQSFVWIDPRQV